MRRTHISKNPVTWTVAAAAALMIPASGAVAQDADMKARSDMEKQWSDMRENAIHASELLRGNYSPGLSPGMDIDNLVLNEKGNKIEYVVLSSDSYPWSAYRQDGYLTWKAVYVHSGVGPGNVDLSSERLENMKGPDTLRITADEANRRLLSRVVDSQIGINDSAVHQIDDVLVNPKSGAVTHFVIGTTPGTVFSTDKRAIPAKYVEWDDGMYTTPLTLEQINDMQEYDPSFL